MGKSAESQGTTEAPARQDVVASLRQVLADLETGKLRSGSWREQYVASALGLVASGCYAEAATHVAQARAMSSAQRNAETYLTSLESAELARVLA